MKLALYGRSMLRETRGSRGRLLFFVGCLAVGVAAIVAVAGLSDAIEAGIREQARELMAGDLAIESRRPLPAAAEEALRDRHDLRVSRIKELVTVVAVPAGSGGPGRSQLVELKAVEAGYPFYGTLESEPAGALAALQTGHRLLVAPDLLRRLQVARGDRLLLGGVPFEIAGTVASEPDRVADAFSLGPRVLVSLEGLAATGLEAFGSRIVHRTLVRLPEGAARPELEALAARLGEILGDDTGYRVETFAEAQPLLREGLRRVERFLGLVALLSLLLGGVGVAQTTRAWLAGRLDAVAILRCLGMRPREALALYLGQAALLGLAGSAAGGLAGIGVQAAVPRLLADLLPVAPAAVVQPAALARGLGLGMAVALLFSFGPLMTVRGVPPLRVLRRDVEPLRTPPWVRVLAGGLLIAGIAAVASVQAGSLALGGQFTAGLVAAAGLLWLTSHGLIRLLGRLPRDAGPLWLRHGVAALARPGAATVGAVVALGLGVLLVAGIGLVERGLADELRAELPHEAPTAFLIDIQPDQWREVEALLRRQGATGIESVPVVTARLSAVDGRGVRELAAARGEERRQRWALTREQRLTYLDELPDDNRLTAGRLWSDPALPEVSVEEEFARELGAGLGSRLQFDVQGVPLELTVTSLRAVDWRTFGINFFLLAEPGTLDRAPQNRLATARLPRDRESAVRDELAAAFPNVTVLDIRSILDKVAAVLDRLAGGVRLLGGFTVLAGIVILAGAVSAGAVRRGREIALLKTLGMTRRDVVARFSTEYLLLGVVAGAVGAGGANLMAWSVLTRGFELDWFFRPGATLAALGASALLTAATGIAAGWRALNLRPLEILRSD